MNEIKMEDEPLQEPKENASVQTKGSKNPKANEQKVKENLKKLHAQRLFWKLNNKNVLG
jgi:hypothetical protein